MAEYELVGRISLGQYLPTGSPIHRLDARVKLLAGLSVLVALVISPSLVGLIAAGIGLIAATAFARAPLTHAARSVRAVLPLTLVVLVLQVAAYNNRGCDVLWQWGFVSITGCGLELAATSLLRLLDMVLLLTLLSLTTTVTDMTRGVEHLARPFSRIGLPAHELALVLAIALRFVPLLGEETERLLKAQAARGADFGAGRRSLVQRVRQMLPLLVPLFVATLRRAEDMATAMDARAYAGSRGRTQLIRLRARRSDWTALAVSLLFAVIIVGLPTISF